MISSNMDRYVRLVVVLGGLVICTFQHLAGVRAPNNTWESRALRFVDKGRENAPRGLYIWKQLTEPGADKITTLTTDRLSKIADQIKCRFFPTAEVKKQMQAAKATGDQRSSQASPDSRGQQPGSWSWWRSIRAIVAVWLLLKVLDNRARWRRAQAANSRRIDPAQADDDESGKPDSNAERRRQSARARLSPTAQFYLSSRIGASPFDRRRRRVGTSTRSSTVQGGTMREAQEASSTEHKDRASKGQPVLSKVLRDKPTADDKSVATSQLFTSGVNHSEAKSSIFQKAAQTQGVAEPAKKETSSVPTHDVSRFASTSASSKASSGKRARSLSEFSFVDDEVAQDCLYAYSFTFHRTNTSYTSSSTLYVDEDYAKLLVRR